MSQMVQSGKPSGLEVCKPILRLTHQTLVHVRIYHHFTVEIYISKEIFIYWYLIFVCWIILVVFHAKQVFCNSLEKLYHKEHDESIHTFLLPKQKGMGWTLNEHSMCIEILMKVSASKSFVGNCFIIGLFYRTAWKMVKQTHFIVSTDTLE